MAAEWSYRTLTLEEFKADCQGSGESVMWAAFMAQSVTDDKELATAAKTAIDAEDDFASLLAKRGVEL